MDGRPHLAPKAAPKAAKEKDVNQNHLSALRQRHADLESKLSAEENRPFPDDTLVIMLKKKKLALKDEILRDSELA